jgi:hypothetical protein
MAYLSVFTLSFLSSARRRMTSRLYPTPCEMNVKRSFKPTAEETKNEEKLKNPQESDTRAPESQGGLKRFVWKRDEDETASQPASQNLKEG